MRVINKSRKIIAINGEPFLPGTEMELPEGMEVHPSVLDYLKKGVLADVNTPSGAVVPTEISDFERARIAEEAIARYKAEQEEAALKAEQEKKAQHEAEVRAVKYMRKDELITKAMGMSLAVEDSDTVDILREKIITALSEQGEAYGSFGNYQKNNG